MTLTPSAVTRRTVGELYGVLNVIPLHQFPPQHEPVLRRLPIHVENLAARPHVLRRVVMAVEAPLHLQRFSLPGQRHPVYAAVTAHATDPFTDMNAVIEVHEVRQVIDPVPTDRLT